jgi:predicted RNase H-like HicB family nuclease
MRFVVVIEKATANFSAFVPDLPGCIATGRTRRQALTRIRAAIKIHIDGMLEDGISPPKPKAVAEYVSLRRSA